MIWYRFHIDKEMASKRSSNKNTDNTSRKEKKGKLFCKLFTKNTIFELYVSLTNMYFLLCIMQSHKMTKLDMIIFDLGPEERKSLMEKLQKDESGEWKNTIYPI